MTLYISGTAEITRDNPDDPDFTMQGGYGWLTVRDDMSLLITVDEEGTIEVRAWPHGFSDRQTPVDRLRVTQQMIDDYVNELSWEGDSEDSD